MRPVTRLLHDYLLVAVGALLVAPLAAIAGRWAQHTLTTAGAEGFDGRHVWLLGGRRGHDTKSQQGAIRDRAAGFDGGNRSNGAHFSGHRGHSARRNHERHRFA